MADQKIVDALRPWMQVDTWHTTHALDAERYHRALKEVFAAVGTSITADEMTEAMKDLGRQLGRPVDDAQYFGPRVERLAEQAEIIASYLHDTGTR